MSGAEFLARYRETEAALQAYVAGLPLWVNIWRGWIFLVFTLGIVFVIRKVEARWLAVAMITSLFGFNLVAMFHGVGRFPSIAFVLLWTPLAIYFTRRRSHTHGDRGFDRVYRIWLDAVTVTLWISVAFDVYNVLYALIRGVA
jgi:hypothetical protein